MAGTGRDFHHMVTFYDNETKGYFDNYNDAKDKINTIVDSLNSLYLAFSSASGNDIDLIRNDIVELKNKLSSIVDLINKKMIETQQKVDSCKGCYHWVKNFKFYPITIGKKMYERGAEVGINTLNGLVYIIRKYKIKQNIIESHLSKIEVNLFSEYTEISKSDMFNRNYLSYNYFGNDK